jgi:hypothetical protein
MNRIDQRVTVGSGSTLRLSFGDHVHAFDAAQKDAGTAKILEPQHRSRAALDRPMVLLDEIVGFCRNKDGWASKGDMISNAYLANE